MEFRFHFHKLCQIERRWLLLVGAVAITHLLFQSLLLPYGNALRSLLPNSNEPVQDTSSFPILQSSTKSVMVRNALTVDTSSSSKVSTVDGVVVKDAVNSGGNGDISHGGGLKRNSGDTENDFSSDNQDQDNHFELAVANDGDTDGFVSEKEDLENPIELVVDRNIDDGFPFEDVVDKNGTFILESIRSRENNSIMDFASEAKIEIPLYQNVKSNLSTDFHLEKELGHINVTLKSPPVGSKEVPSLTNITSLRSNGSSSIGSAIHRDGVATSKNDLAKMNNHGRKKMRCEMPPKSVTSINEMDSILERHRRSSRSMRPRWSSPRDREILAARSQIEGAPVAVNDRDLYAPLFRNVSKFKRSYELMERTLKVYIYRDGKKPIFHLPILKGLYASEGWFMKLMQGNKRFLVKDPRKAHLFYMPFSSRMLEYALYVRNSHNRTNLRQYLKEYTEKIAAKYPYFNRTDGADHFLVACHDWAPYETRHHMEHCIKALCNADVTVGFKIGRDVSLPETYVRSARNPLRDLGGKPPSQRHILAFYAGNMHGYLRPILQNELHPAHEEQQVLHLPQGLRGQQPKSG
ncbi:uncharacterized protein LOC105637768 [Jatropha curcas]|uniref:uncharacterized protein LOC105637768 n=1 Tax=Jatropha curcas TaxID=180498 RepID=UPI0009D751EB|nr:uncharacterized protein LOC105637768 [Jatropha curcas]